jgi:hypothetical protein
MKKGSRMFCPKCGAVFLSRFSEHGIEELCCEKGKMSLSPIMQRKFEERYRANAIVPFGDSASHQHVHSEFHWFCPGDGERLNGRLECLKCGKHLRDLFYQLVELHSHE